MEKGTTTKAALVAKPIGASLHEGRKVRKQVNLSFLKLLACMTLLLNKLCVFSNFTK